MQNQFLSAFLESNSREESILTEGMNLYEACLTESSSISGYFSKIFTGKDDAEINEFASRVETTNNPVYMDQLIREINESLMTINSTIRQVIFPTEAVLPTIKLSTVGGAVAGGLAGYSAGIKIGSQVLALTFGAISAVVFAIKWALIGIPVAIASAILVGIVRRYNGSTVEARNALVNHQEKLEAILKDAYKKRAALTKNQES